jgi:hypothetical protein
MSLHDHRWSCGHHEREEDLLTERQHGAAITTLEIEKMLRSDPDEVKEATEARSRLHADSFGNQSELPSRTWADRPKCC